MIVWEARSALADLDRVDSVRTMERLSAHTTKLIASSRVTDATQTMLDAAIDLHEADFGNVQLLNATNRTLEIVAQRGFDPIFLETFRSVSADDSCSCGRALRARASVFIADVDQDPEYAPFAVAARAAGYRAVQSTPMISSADKLVGVLSTHFRLPHEPSAATMRLVTIYARQAADIVVRFQEEQALLERNAQRDEAMAELDHRLKNVITMIQSIARQTIRRTSDMGEFAQSFENRLGALSRAHQHLQTGQWQAATIAGVLSDQLAPYAGPNLSWSGSPDIKVGANAAYSLALVIHELAVNARKHGALSTPAGQVAIEWSPAANDTVTVRWIESGGPTVELPVSRGFGTTLISRLMQSGCAESELRFDPSGVVCSLQLPLAPD